MTWRQFAQQVAAIHGVTLTDEQADQILVEHTPFPISTDPYRIARDIRTTLSGKA